MLKIDIDNGDLKALQTAMNKWRFKNEESMLKYVIAVLLSSNKRLYVDDADDKSKKTALEPVDGLLKPTTANGSSADGTNC